VFQPRAGPYFHRDRFFREGLRGWSTSRIRAGTAMYILKQPCQGWNHLVLLASGVRSSGAPVSFSMIPKKIANRCARVSRNAIRSPPPVKRCPHSCWPSTRFITCLNMRERFFRKAGRFSAFVAGCGPPAGPPQATPTRYVFKLTKHSMRVFRAVLHFGFYSPAPVALVVYWKSPRPASSSRPFPTRRNRPEIGIHAGQRYRKIVDWAEELCARVFFLPLHTGCHVPEFVSSFSQEFS